MKKIQNLQAPAPVVLFEELSDGEAYEIRGAQVAGGSGLQSGPAMIDANGNLIPFSPPPLQRIKQ